MNALAFFVAGMQVSAWSVSPTPVTVGDTVYMTRRIVTDGAVHARAQPPVATDDMEPLAEPQVEYAEGVVRVRYIMAFFDARRHAVLMPDVELVYSDGRLVRVPSDTAWVSIASVLPTSDSLLAAQPVVEPLPRTVKRAEPLVWLLGAALLAASWWGIARRRARPRPPWPAEGGVVVHAPYQRWLGAGEPRAVATAIAGALRVAIERAEPAAGRQLSTAECRRIIETARPEWPVGELVHTLGALDRARFAPVVASDLVKLTEDADRLAQVLVPPPASVE